MLTETITLQIEADAARVYNDAQPDDRQKLQALFETWLRQYADADPDSLKAVMDEISRKAESRGLTPEVLEKILTNE